MGERKVLNKYLPPDFDPEQLARGVRQIKKRERERKVASNHQIKVRMMLPMSIRCNSCGTYIYKGTKFNSRKEDADETYLGIKIIRLYFRCPQCASELAIKTDPKNSDYVVELGATRNFEPSREREHEKVEAEAERQREEEGDAMRQLENKASEGKVQDDIDNALDEMMSLNARKEAMIREAGSTPGGRGDAVIDAALRQFAGESGGGGDATGHLPRHVDNDAIDEENDDEVRLAFAAQRAQLAKRGKTSFNVPADGGAGVFLSRIDDDDDDEDNFVSNGAPEANVRDPHASFFAADSKGGSSVDQSTTKRSRFKIQKKRPAATPGTGAAAAAADGACGGRSCAPLGLLGGYGSSDDEDGDE